jgi:pSer/pThr/pTyr-binding forkhead associated (FHA) protein
MGNIPVIVIQLIHIEGPLKGEIQEFSDPEISIGRHPSCHVQFLKDMRIVSRQHARIIREGNRFKLINQSKNGTYLNGKIVPEAYLKNGDVLMFAQGGPKISFLTKIEEVRQAVDRLTPAAPKPPDTPPKTPPAERPPAPPVQSKPQPAPDVSIQKIQVPLIIQYGPTLRSFNELPVTIGKGPGCDFILNHPSIFDQHAQLFFSHDQYWVKDLTGQQSVSINGQPINIKAPLNPDNQLALSLQGPSFRFLGGGRLAEIEDPIPDIPVDELPARKKASEQTDPNETDPKKPRSVFKKLFF